MKTTIDQIEASETDDFVEVDSFSTSIAPVNIAEKLCFNFRDRLCCAGFLLAIVTMMRLLLSN